jgi:hypothetical protein
MKKITVFVCALAMAICLSSCGAKSEKQGSEPADSVSVSTESSSPDLAAAAPEATSVPSVEITIPESLVESMKSSAGATLESALEGSGAYDFVYNSDGSLTFMMDKVTQEKHLSNLKGSYKKLIGDYVGSSDYPDVKSIKENDDFTEFTVTTTHTAQDVMDIGLGMVLQNYGATYSIWNGTNLKANDITVLYLNEATGEQILPPD